MYTQIHIYKEGLHVIIAQRGRGAEGKMHKI